ncbi:alpha-L-fucosidase-like isoform X1 [Apostichopus japonicus]|uniref:alpha-L-fucosidase-like isoform X1 n=1 Tax=Stichopus japonicus TaxID=307972 RepID=UPI003AB3611C
MELYVILILCLTALSVKSENIKKTPKQGPYLPNWDSIDSRPLPGWYDQAKFGIFMHWGVYSVPAFGTEWFWHKWKADKNPRFVEFMKENYPPNFQYPDFGSQFTAEMFDANYFADVIQASGAQYVVLTSKHHEGFTNYASNFSWNWNSVDIGPNRDLVGEMAEAIRAKTDIKFGLYYSLYEWFHPLFLKDAANNFMTQDYMEMVMRPQLLEIVNKYKPYVIWADGSGRGPDTYWNATDFLAWLYNDSPVKDYVVTNDRWGYGNLCKHGGYFTCHDRYNPGVLQNHKWENAMTIDKSSWGFRRDTVIKDFLTMKDITKTLAETISCGGNLLMNFGPTHDGRIIPIFEERLRQTGAWLGVNGEAVYASNPWRAQNDTLTPGVWYTMKNSSVYAFVLDWPKDNTLDLGAPAPSASTVVTMLGVKTPLQWSKGAKPGVTMTVQFPPLAGPQLPCDYAWVLKMNGVN